MRFQSKGGVQKNTEDEILKAAVMKYGLNQQSRISSLLVRKAAKQCKARWYEQLDPSIKKTEQSREEEEKLLHLAKIMPTQWRTIAPIIGRTAAQCLQHYEKLLDVAQLKDDTENADKILSDPKRLRPGEIDPNPETKPARPDPIDMDEDEKEMLSEARARLANTKGKKAKRKARERQLNEARRLASLQKDRELKAAGITIHERFSSKRKNQEMDYNREIPFYQEQPKGFYDTTEEDKLAIENRQEFDFRNLTSETFEGKRRDAIEARERKKDLKRQKIFRQHNLPAAIDNINRLNDPNTSVLVRNPINLPAPQVSDIDLENIARLRGETISNDMGAGEGVAGSANLLSQYSSIEQTPLTALRTPATHNETIQREIEDIIAVTHTETPLAGGQNKILHSRKQGALPEINPNLPLTPNIFSKSQAENLAQTPLASLTPNSIGYPSENTPKRFGYATPSMTPQRNDINLVDTPIREQIALENKRRKVLKKRMKKLSSSFKKLPLPKEIKSANIIMPVFEFDDEVEKKLNGNSSEEEPDAADLDFERIQKQKEIREAELKRRSQSIQRDLPRPRIVNFNQMKNLMLERHKQLDHSFINTDEFLKEYSEGIEFKAAELLMSEMVSMIHYDNIKFPLINGVKLSSEQKNLNAEKLLDPVDQNYLALAKRLLEKEIREFKDDDKEATKFSYEASSFEANNDIKFLPATRLFGSFEQCDQSTKLNCLKQEFTVLQAQFHTQRKRSQRISSKIDLLTGGYRKRVDKTKNTIGELLDELHDLKTELYAFEKIWQREHKAVPFRIEALRRDVHQEIEREKILQHKYKQLSDEIQELENFESKNVQLANKQTAQAST